MSIVRNLARLMGGEAGCESVPGQGAHFWFTLRAQIDNTATAARIQSDADFLRPAHAAGQLPTVGNVLVVEDDPTNLKVCLSFLGKLGLTTRSATDGQQGLASVVEAPPDLILMDCQMPVMDGYEATRRIRAREQAEGLKHIPIIAITADAFAEDRAAALAAGMDDFLAKPFVMDALAEKLRRWLPAGHDLPQEKSPPPKVAQHAVFSPELLVSQLDGDLDLARIIVESGMKDLPGYFQAMARDAEREGGQQVQRTTHTLKGLLRQMGAPRLAQLLADIDQQLKQGKSISEEQLAVLKREYGELTAALEQWLADKTG